MNSRSDSALLRDFLSERDEQAFEALVDRHGPMVFHVARRILHSDADSEDVVQAVFLTLATKASTLKKSDSLPGWLYHITFRAALNEKKRAGRQRAREEEAERMKKRIRDEDQQQSDLLEVAYSELDALPEKHRTPLVLHHLEGHSHAEAAHLLGINKSAFTVRLSRARQFLKKKIERRSGSGMAGALLFFADNQMASLSAVSPQFSHAIAAKALTAASGAGLAGGVASTNVIQLMKGVESMLLWAKVKSVAAILAVTVAVGASGGGVYVATTTAAADNPPVLPAIQAQDLADLLESYENQVRKLQTKASLVYGTAPQDNVMRGPFTPKDPPYSLTQESALDFGASAEYVKERQLTQGQYDNRESAFDGKIGTRLVGGDDIRKHMFGVIEESRPPELAYDEPHHPRPAEAAYWPIPGRSLSELVRSASKVEIKTDTVGGMSCYRVTILTHEAVTFTHEGKTLTGKRNVLCRAWLSPAVGMLPVRFDTLQQKSADDMEGIPKVIRYQSDFREVAPGIWFPFASRRCRMWVGKEPTVTAMTIEEVKLNDDADVKTRVNFPATTYVKDKIRGIKYRVGLNPSDIDTMVKDIASTADMASLTDQPVAQEEKGGGLGTQSAGQPGVDHSQLPLGAVEYFDEPWRLIGWAIGGGVVALITFVLLSRRHRQHP